MRCHRTLSSVHLRAAARVWTLSLVTPSPTVSAVSPPSSRSVGPARSGGRQVSAPRVPLSCGLPPASPPGMPWRGQGGRVSDPPRAPAVLRPSVRHGRGSSRLGALESAGPHGAGPGDTWPGGSAMRGSAGAQPAASSRGPGRAVTSGPCGACPRRVESGPVQQCGRAGELCVGTPRELSDAFEDDAGRGMCFGWNPGPASLGGRGVHLEIQPHAGRGGCGLRQDSRHGPRQLFET